MVDRKVYDEVRRTAWHKRKVRNCMELSTYMARQCMADIGRMPTVAEYITWAGLKITPTAKSVASRAIKNLCKENGHDD